MDGERFDEFQRTVRPHLRFLAEDQEIDPRMSLTSLGLNSMEQVSLLIDLETAFDVTIPDEFLVQETFTSIETLWTVMDGLLRAAGAVAEG